MGNGTRQEDNKPDISGLALSSRLIHADLHVDDHAAVAPAMHTSTTFRYHNDPDLLVDANNIKFNELGETEQHYYSRHSSPNMARLETLLSSLLGARAITYSSGLAAFHALLVCLNPRRIAIGPGYHGCDGVIRIMQRLTGLEVLPLDCDAGDLGPGDVVHIETPCNPTGEARNIRHYADKAHAAGALLVVDATFGPPPLQDPFRQGADVVMHSGTKYIGGHSDMLCGVLAARELGITKGLLADRPLLGCVMGSLEGWLGMRSLRTLELRVRRQSETATRLVRWLAGELETEKSPVGAVLERLQHASLQEEGEEWLRRQMDGGYGPVFAIWARDEADAKRLPSKLALFQHATSLGGVESLIEWRAMTDPRADSRLLRVSVGVEDFEDLKADLLRGLKALRP